VPIPAAVGAVRPVKRTVNSACASGVRGPKGTPKLHPLTPVAAATRRAVSSSESGSGSARSGRRAGRTGSPSRARSGGRGGRPARRSAGSEAGRNGHGRGVMASSRRCGGECATRGTAGGMDWPRKGRAGPGCRELQEGPEGRAGVGPLQVRFLSCTGTPRSGRAAAAPGRVDTPRVAVIVGAQFTPAPRGCVNRSQRKDERPWWQLPRQR
jgi:hypothetical protein